MEQLIHHLSTLLQNNQFASGGLLMVLVGGTLAYARSIPQQLFQWVRKHVIVSIDITNDDPVFEWVSMWLEQHPYNNKARRLTVSSRRDRNGYIQEGSRFIFSPSTGNHIFFHGRRIFWMSRSREKMEMAALGGKFSRETIELRTVGRSQKPLRQLVNEAYKLSRKDKTETISIYNNNLNDWNFVRYIEPRSLSTVYLPDGVKDDLIDDVKEFYKDEQWYKNLGIPFRRGFLLSGIPGSGKTSLIKAIAGMFKMDIYSLNLSEERLTDTLIEDVLSTVPKHSVIVIEDIDAIFNGRERDKSVQGGVTFKGLLNALDGISSSEGSLLFITTNYLDRLDSALIRPGRIDKSIEFTFADANQLSRIVSAFYPAAEPTALRQLTETLTAKSLSMAQVQQVLLEHRSDYSPLLAQQGAH